MYEKNTIFVRENKNKMKILYLNLKKEWYNAIESGDKTEEYREIKEYWIKRLTNLKHNSLLFSYRYGYTPIPYKNYTHVCFIYGYTKRNMTYPITNISFGFGKSEWGAPEDKEVFIIKFDKTQKVNVINQ